MRRRLDPALPFASAPFVLALTLAAGSAHATGRQFNLGPMVGGSLQFGSAFSPGPSVGFHFGYGLNDMFRVYGQFDYALTFNLIDPMNPTTLSRAGARHTGVFAAGIVYTLDVTTVVPWFGLGVNVGVVGQDGWIGPTLGPEARGGADILFSRYIGMTAQVAYSLVLLNRDRISGTLSIEVGLRFALDL